MTYVHVTRTPGKGMDDYREILKLVGDEPVAGRAAHYAGTENGSLLIVDVWHSRSDADRFAAERLFPAFAGVFGGPPADTLIMAYDVEHADA